MIPMIAPRRTVVSMCVILAAAITLLLSSLPAHAGDAQSPVTAGSSSTDGPLPVIYVSASSESRSSAEAYADSLRNHGLDVHVFMTWEPDDPSTSPYVTVKGNSARLATFVDKLKQQTGHDKFDVVTWSQGGLVTRYWLKYFGGADFVRKAVILSGMIKGSPHHADALRKGQCPPPNARLYVPQELLKSPSDTCLEMSSEGESIRSLNTPSEALPGIKYYAVTTKQEINAAPYGINLMDGPGDYTNIITQDLCPNDIVGHGGLTKLPSMQALVSNLLKDDNPTMPCMAPDSPNGLPTLGEIIPPLTSAPSFG
ncbi:MULTISPECIES: esterase/lipase family protein [Corynebacterium]|uniref:esterase/lipase family protein n=1 Tax=Corynebacterium TaxID=1716 RepID=UPI00195CCE9E|nr:MULTISPECIES: lipase [Corynebacterium]MDN8624530.1 lipase [Corynebacterium kroppenstedtii]QRQ65216.1 lipase [Corynebacterium kroppenstedtii]